MASKKLPMSLRLRARAAGRMDEGAWRVMVIESDSRVSALDFTDIEEAIKYANDAASESDWPTPVAYVLDDRLRVVHQGRHYASGGKRKVDTRYASTPFDWVDDEDPFDGFS